MRKCLICVGVAETVLNFWESFRSLLIGVAASTSGGFINQVSGPYTLGRSIPCHWGELTVGQLIAFSPYLVMLLVP